METKPLQDIIYARHKTNKQNKHTGKKKPTGKVRMMWHILILS